MVQNLGITKRFIKVGKISAKIDILTVQEKQLALRYNKTKRIPETNHGKEM